MPGPSARTNVDVIRRAIELARVEKIRLAGERARGTTSTIASSLLHLMLAAPVIGWSFAPVHAPKPDPKEPVTILADTDVEGLEPKLGASGVLSNSRHAGPPAPDRPGDESPLSPELPSSPSPEEAADANVGGGADLQGGSEAAGLDNAGSGLQTAGRAHPRDAGRSRSPSRALHARTTAKGARSKKKAKASDLPVGGAPVEMFLGPPNAADALLYGDGNGAGAGGRPQNGASPPRLGGHVIWNCPFPASADQSGIDQGIAHLTADVDADGTATAAQIVDDDGYGFGPQAMRCALAYHFIAGRDAQGQPVAGHTEIFAVQFNRVYRRLH